MMRIQDLVHDASLANLITAYDQFISQSHVQDVIAKASDPWSHKVAVIGTIRWRQQEFKLQTGETMPYTKEEAFVALGVPLRLIDQRREPLFGSDRGVISISDDFDNPLDDFED